MHRYLTWLKLRSMTIPKTADAFTIYKSEKVRSKCVCLTSNVHIHQYEHSIRTFFTLNVEVSLWLGRHTWLGYITIYYNIVSTIISLLTDTLLKRTPRVSPCILLLLLVYLNNLDICLGALSICQNWPAALLPDQSVNEFENDIGFSKSVCWKPSPSCMLLF